ncbi:MAG: ATP synthase F1 subunit delta [Bacteroidota bacterium]|nr:ATP synthase F1 subunit delta [Bacteroidota bacterium]
MNESKISVRYAKALFNLAKEKNILDEIKKDVDLLNEICNIEEFDEFLNSPIIPVSKKMQVFDGIFRGNINQIVLDTLLLIGKNRRETFLILITLNFLTYYRKYIGITEVNFTTASEVSEENKQNIKKLLQQIIQGKIELKHNINSDLIGGFVLRVDDKQIDSSVRTQLKDIKKELIK